MPGILASLQKSRLFSGFDHEILKEIAARFRRVVFEAEDLVFREGEQGHSMFLLVQGEVVVLKDMGWGQRELKTLRPGELFGEMALISHERRSATIKAVSRAECLQMNIKDFNELLETNARFAQRVLNLLTQRLRHSDEVATQQLVNAHRAMTFSLAKLAESRDPETGGHLYRVRDYCTFLAEKLSRHPRYLGSVYPGFIESIHFVSPLHDIGKVAIPDAILLKAGKLDDREYEIMKSHARIGAEAIATVLDYCDDQTFRMAYNLVRHHHERFDGTGYPDKLAGEEIPLEARIMALADVFDALICRRVYKEPMEADEVIRIMKEASGTQFDPLMTEILLAHIDGFKDISKRYADAPPAPSAPALDALE